MRRPSALPRPLRRPRSRALPSGGFTLIELLVVIAIIALLVGILVPSLASARRSAMTARCLSNIRQLEMAHVLYMNDFREHFIDAGLGHGGISSIETAWPVQLAEYGGAGLVLRSPVDKSRYWPVSDGGDDPGLSRHHGAAGAPRVGWAGVYCHSARAARHHPEHHDRDAAG